MWFSWDADELSEMQDSFVSFGDVLTRVLGVSAYAPPARRTTISLSRKVLAALVERQNGFCVYCPNSIRQVYHKDHKLPLARGGTDAIENIQLLCPRCNIRKGKKTHREFMAYLVRSGR